MSTVLQSEYVIEALGQASDEVSLPLPQVEGIGLALLTSIASTLERQPGEVTAREFGEQLFEAIGAFTGPGPDHPTLFELSAA